MHLREVDANLLVTLDALLVDASVTRAAERLGRSASAISHALAKLREIFADELFVRAGQRLVPTAKALELLWTADFIEAPKALELGIVNRVVPHDKLHEETYAFARRVADGPQIPVRMIKRLVYQSMRLDLRTHLDLVSSHMAVVRETEDHKEGVQAFKDKRPPKFTGR